MPLPCTTRTRGSPAREGAVDEFFDFAGGLIDGASDDVDFAGDVRAFVLQRD